MSNEMEMSIDLRDLLYCVVKRWRSIIVVAVVIALLAGAFKVGSGLATFKDDETLAQEQSDYENALADHEAQGEILAQKVEGLEESVAARQKYNENSYLMQMDPMEKYVGAFVAYVDSGYQINPNLSYQDIDMTHRLLTAYNAYLHSGETYDEILGKTNVVSEVSYLTEILTYTVEPEAASITVQCVGKSAADVQEVLGAVKACIEDKSVEIQRAIGAHSYSILVQSVYNTVDLSLYDEQQKSIQAVSDGMTDLETARTALSDWEKAKPAETSPDSMVQVAKGGIKYAVLGGVVGAVLMAGIYAVIYLFSQTVKLESDWDAFGLPVLGRICRDTEKKALWQLDRWLARYIGNRREMTMEVSCQLAGHNLRAVLKEKSLPSCVLVGDVDETLANDIVEKMNRAANGNCFRYAGNILANSEAIEQMGGTTEVVLLAKNYATTYENIKEERVLLNAWGKSILGVVTVA